MSAPERLVALFLAPPGAEAEAISPAAPAGRPVVATLAAVPDAVPGLRVCVLGGGGSGTTFAQALASRLARLPGARCAVLCVAIGEGGETVGRPPGLPSAPGPRARRLARALAGDGLSAGVRGRVVEVAVRPACDPEVGQVLARACDHAAGAPVVTVVPGARSAVLDGALQGQDVVLAVVAVGAPGSLSDLAVAELQARAPGAVVEAVPLPPRGGGVARRAAVGRVLDALR